MKLDLKSSKTNLAADVASDIVKSGARKAIINVVVRQVMAALILRLPFLSFGPLSFLASFVLEKLVSLIIDKTILGANIGIVNYVIDKEVKEVERLIEKAKAVPEGNTDELKKIEDDLIEASRNLISLRDKPRVLS